MSDHDLNPQPRAWPQCSVCKTPYVLRRGLLFDRKAKSIFGGWGWQRDCKHSKAAPEAAGSLRISASRRKRSR